MIHLLIGMLIFAFFAIAGLVVDLGFARVTHRQMANAADAAALEGMRLKDAAADADRRDAARTILRSHFDDDFEATADDAMRLGAGPLPTLSGGTGSMLANQTLGIAPSIVYKPDPELNLPNADNGDMVAGYYDDHALAHAESQTYERTDFTTTADPALRDAFLVRLRRTPDKLSLDNQPGVSSGGPQLPYLFGRGSMISSQTRKDGITVRGTGIAAGRPATLVGPDFPETALDPDPANRVIGVSVLAMQADWFAQEIPFDTDYRLNFGVRDENGNAGGANPFPPGQGGEPPGQVIPPGQLVGNRSIPVLAFLDFPEHYAQTGRNAWSMGDEIIYNTNLTRAEIAAALGNPVAGTEDDRIWYIALFNDDSTLGWDGKPGLKWDNWIGPRIVGFGAIQVLEIVDQPANNGNGGNNGNNGNGGNNGNNGNNGNPSSNPGFSIVIRKLRTFVAPWNASAVETPGAAGLTKEGLDAIRLDRLMLESNGSALRAASLVR